MVARVGALRRRAWRLIDALFPQLHVVHYDSESYHTLSEAAQRPQGLAVLGILIEVSGPHFLPGPSPAPLSPSVPFRPCLLLVSLRRRVSNHSAHLFSTRVSYCKHGLMPDSPLPFQVGETKNPAYEHILSHLHKIRYKGEP